MCAKRWCEVLGVRTDDSAWDVSVLSANHHAAVPSEIETLQSAHPGESEVILNNRVLGGIAITRGLSSSRSTMITADTEVTSCGRPHLQGGQTVVFQSPHERRTTIQISFLQT